VFHSRPIWQEITGEDEPRRCPVCDVTVAEQQGEKTVKHYRYDVVQDGEAEQPCDPQLSLTGRLAKLCGREILWEPEP
jgi:hypothetical protein